MVIIVGNFPKNKEQHSQPSSSIRNNGSSSSETRGYVHVDTTTVTQTQFYNASNGNGGQIIPQTSMPNLSSQSHDPRHSSSGQGSYYIPYSYGHQTHSSSSMQNLQQPIPPLPPLPIQENTVTLTCSDLSQVRQGNLLEIVADMFMQQSKLSAEHAKKLKQLSKCAKRNGQDLPNNGEHQNEDGVSGASASTSIVERNSSEENDTAHAAASAPALAPGQTCNGDDNNDGSTRHTHDSTSSLSETLQKDAVINLAKKSYEAMLEMQQTMDNLLNNAMIQSFRNMSDNHDIDQDLDDDGDDIDEDIGNGRNEESRTLDEDNDGNASSLFDSYMKRSQSHESLQSPSASKEHGQSHDSSLNGTSVAPNPRSSLKRERDDISSDSESEDEETRARPSKLIKRERDDTSSDSESEDEETRAHPSKLIKRETGSTSMDINI